MVPHFHWNVTRLLAIVFDRIDREQWSLRVRQRSDPALQRAGIARAADTSDCARQRLHVDA
jgi:hypothetical protein